MPPNEHSVLKQDLRKIRERVFGHFFLGNEANKRMDTILFLCSKLEYELHEAGLV